MAFFAVTDTNDQAATSGSVYQVKARPSQRPPKKVKKGNPQKTRRPNPCLEPRVQAQFIKKSLRPCVFGGFRLAFRPRAAQPFIDKRKGILYTPQRNISYTASDSTPGTAERRTMLDQFLCPRHLVPLLVPLERRCKFPPAKQRAPWERLPQATRGILEAWGQDALSGYPTLTATQFMAYRRTGDRQAWEQPYFIKRKRLIGAALSLCLTPDSTVLQDAVMDGLFSTLEESSWIVCAHHDTADILPDPNKPCIDLFSAQTGATLAFVCHLLRDVLPPYFIERTVQEIDKRILIPFLTRQDFHWMGFSGQKLNNWTPWILSNIIDALLLSEKNTPRLAQGLCRAMRILQTYLKGLPPDGGLDEGIGYWNVAGASVLDCLESLDAATNGAVQIYDAPIIRALGAFPLASHIAGPYFWNFADCDAKPYVNWQRVWRFGVLHGSAPLQALGAERFSPQDDIFPKDTPQMNRVLQALFAPPPKNVPSFPPPSFTALNALEVFAWRKNDMYVALKGGRNDESHNHNDIGSFIVYFRGEPVVTDAGNAVYTGRSFGKERYEQWHTRCAYHNVPCPNGVEQQAGGQYAAADVRADENGASMELQNAYPKEACLKSFRRTLSFMKNGLCVEDALTFQRARPVDWHFLLRHEPIISQNSIRIGPLTLRYPPALTPGIEKIPITDVRMARSYPGCLWRLTLSAKEDAAHQNQFQFVHSEH